MKKSQQPERIIKLLQSICLGDKLTISLKEKAAINELIMLLSRQIPLPVTEYVVYPRKYGCYISFEICPACNAHIKRTYQSCCDNCGQKLKWISLRKMKNISHY